LKIAINAITSSITGKKNHGRFFGFPEENNESFVLRGSMVYFYKHGF